MPNLLVILSLISFLSIIVVTGSPLKSYTNFYENNNHILLKLPTIYAQDNSGYFDDGDIFPDFKTEDDGGKEKDGGNEGRINENTNSFSPLSSGTPTNTDDKVNPYDEVGQPVGQQSEQKAEDSVVDQQSGQQVDQQTIGTNQTEQQTISNEVNQTEQQQDN